MCSTQVNGKLTGELPLFCPLESCSHYQKPDNTIKKDGIYRTQSDPVPRQMYYCHGGGHRFSETHYSELKHKQGSMKEYEQKDTYWQRSSYSQDFVEKILSSEETQRDNDQPTFRTPLVEVAYFTACLAN